MTTYNVIGIKKQDKEFNSFEKIVKERIGEVVFPLQLVSIKKCGLGFDIVKFPNGAFVNTSLLEIEKIH